MIYYDYAILLLIILLLHALINATCAVMMLYRYIAKPLNFDVALIQLSLPVCSPNTCRGVFNQNVTTLQLSQIVPRVCVLVLLIRYAEVVQVYTVCSKTGNFNYQNTVTVILEN